MTTYQTTATRHQTRGFSLVEIMVVVVIVGILSAIALPAYNQHIQKTRRGEAAAFLRANEQHMQRFYQANNRYDQNLSGTAVTLPYQRSPADGTLAYTIQFQAGQLGRTNFVIEAVPQGSMANNDSCGTLRINNLGVRSVTGSGKTAADCWR